MTFSIISCAKFILKMMLITKIALRLIGMFCFLLIICSVLSVNHFSRDRRNQPVVPTTVRSDNKCRAGEIRIDGMRVVSTDKSIEYDDENIPELIARTKARLRIFGCGFTDHTVVTFTKQMNDRNGACLLPASGQFKVESDGLLEYTATVDIVVPVAESTPYYFCVKNAEEEMEEKVSYTNIPNISCKHIQ